MRLEARVASEAGSWSKPTSGRFWACAARRGAVNYPTAVNMVHESFGVKMDDDIVDGFKTVGDMVDYVVTHYEKVPWCVSPERRNR